MTDLPIVTSAKVWRQSVENASVLASLPSGNVARVRAIDLGVFIRYGKIPDYLTAMVSEAVFNERVRLPEVTDLTAARAYAEFLNALCEGCFVEPRVVPIVTDPDTQITVDMITWEDKAALFRLFALPFSQLSSFRPFQVQPMETVDIAKDHPAASEFTASDERVGV